MEVDLWMLFLRHGWPSRMNPFTLLYQFTYNPPPHLPLFPFPSELQHLPGSVLSTHLFNLTLAELS